MLKVDKDVMGILLQDKTTGKNIIWATDNYLHHGSAYGADEEILVDLVISRNGDIIRPRIEKSRAEQQERVRQKAEVFTPSWICNAQNNLVDNAWLGREAVFNKENEGEKTWLTTEGSISFSPEKGKAWQDYVQSSRLEITCGEAPYLTSRYDTVTGNYIAVPYRIGMLDRKLRVVNENVNDKEGWLHWAIIAVQNTYGFEWQGDNVLIARENILLTTAEHFHHKFGFELSVQELVEFAKIIVWNIWQMDGLKFVVPNSCCRETKSEVHLLKRIGEPTECEGCKRGDYKKHNGIYCRIKDWKTGKTIRFADLLQDSD